MATFTQLLGLQSGVQAVAQSGDTIDFTGFTLTNFSTTAIDDGTGDLTLNGSGGLSSTGITTMALDSSDTTNLSMAANAAVDKTLTIGSANAGAGAANLDVNVKSALTMDAGTFSLDSTGTSNVTTTGAALTVSTATSGTLTISSAGDLGVTGAGASTFGDTTATWDFDGSGALATTGMTTVDLDCSGALSLNSSGGAINVGNDAVAQAINVGTGAAARTITVGNTTGATAVNLDAGTGGIVGEVQDSQAAAFSVGISGGSKNVTLSTSNNAFAVTGVALALQNTDGSSPIAQSYGGKAAGAYTQHHLLTIDATSGEFSTFDCEQGDNLMGTALLAAAAQSDPAVLGIGGIVNVVFDSAPAAASIGSFVYALGATGSNAGKVGLTAPTASGARVWKVGILVAADGVATTTQIQWQPQFLYDVP